MEREREEASKRLFEELEVGQVREGTVRSLRDFGAFVDLGGVDGLIHISQLSWDRVNHPSEVLSEGQAVKSASKKSIRKLKRSGSLFVTRRVTLGRMSMRLLPMALCIRAK